MLGHGNGAAAGTAHVQTLYLTQTWLFEHAQCLHLVWANVGLFVNSVLVYSVFQLFNSLLCFNRKKENVQAALFTPTVEMQSQLIRVHNIRSLTGNKDGQ